LRGEIIWQKGKTTSGSCAWGSFRTPSNPVLRDTTERIIVASKGRFDRARTQQERRRNGDPHVATLTNDEFVESTIDVWEIPAESARRVSHPAPFPVELPLKLIDLYTYEDDLVLDPFMGSGSTLVAARKAGRRSVGYDVDVEYVELAQSRLEQAARRPRYDTAEPFEPTLPEMPEPLPAEHFQARASQQGKKAQDLARVVLENSGFKVLKKQPKLAKLGIEFNFLVENEQEGLWYVDVSGAFTTVRPGLQRTDTLWKALGRAHVYYVAGDPTVIPLLILTSNLPKPGSEGWKALKAVGPTSVFDAVEMLSEEGQKRLHHYGRIDGSQPVPGFWTEDEIVGAKREPEG
jgi:site-specific DNA-methyltransferase (adenine-specific)